MIGKLLGLLFLVVAACGSPEKRADTTASLVPDTVKPAPPIVDTAGQKTSATQSKSTQTTGKKGVAGRDSVIRFDLKDPRRNLPPVDTTKRPPTTDTGQANKVAGRDSVIRFDLSDPRRQLGRPDTTKRRPPR